MTAPGCLNICRRFGPQLLVPRRLLKALRVCGRRRAGQQCLKFRLYLHNMCIEVLTLELESKMVERLRRLAALVDRGTVTQTEISTETGVSQSQVSRILSGQFRRASKNVLAICRYASLRRERPRSSEASDRAALTTALLALWDGTPSHAQALIDMLSAIGAAQQRSRKALR